jgi:hypothetical protein
MSLYLDLMGSTGKVATVSIRRLGLPREGFGLVFAYEITENKHIVRGTVERDEESEDLRLVADVLADYAAKAKEASDITSR